MNGLKDWQSALIPYFLLLLIAGVTVFLRLGGLPFTGADEPRYARIAEEMYRSGRWITPTLEGLPWLEKPPLYYWSTIPFYALFGVSETTARLAPAVFALLASCAVCWAGARIWTPLAGLMGGVMVITTMGFSVFGRGASTDMPFTACFTASLAIMAVIVVENRRSAGKAALAWILLALAVLAKGPVAFALVGGIVLLFWAFDERGGSIRRLHLFSGLLLAIVLAAPWYWLAFRQNGFSFIAIYLINHNLARYVSDVHHHAQPSYYYVPVVLGLFFPWTGWLLALAGRGASALRHWRRWDSGTLFVACWLLFPLLFFSLATSKLPGYVVISLPPLALLVAPVIEGWATGASAGREKTAARWLQLAVAVLMAAAFPAVLAAQYGEHWTRGLLPALAALLPAAYCLWAARRNRWWDAFSGAAAQGMIVVAAITQFAFPVLGNYHSTQVVASQALGEQREAEPIVTYRFFHHTLFYYTGYRISAQLKGPDDLVRFAYRHPRFLIVTEDRWMPEIRQLSGFLMDVRGRQGKLRLVRISHF